jgi:predicted nucleotidyltransferase
MPGVWRTVSVVPDNIAIKPEHLALVKAILRRYVPKAEVRAYGSRISGGSHDASDLDIVLRLPDGAAVPREDVSGLKDALSESDIPFIVDARDWAGLPENFREEILKACVVVQSPGIK